MGGRVVGDGFGRFGRTVGDLRAAIEARRVAKTELQLYGLDWAQIEDEPDAAPLREVFARHGAVVEPSAPTTEDPDRPGRVVSGR